MYFPKEILDVKNILRNLDDEISNYEKIAIIDSCIERLNNFRPRFLLEPHKWTHIKNEILEELRHAKEKCKRSITQRLGELTMQDYNPAIKIFIAGAKKLKEERSLLREELSKVENANNLDIRALTFEDFATSLTGEDRGRQADYNKFIEKEANVVIFIFDSTAGEITEEEFDIAYNSLKENRHPDIFVYVRKRSPFSFRNIFGDRRLQNIKNKIFAYQKEYYIEYENLDNLRYLFYSDMVSYFQKKND